MYLFFFYSQIIKAKFGIKTEEAEYTVVSWEPVKSNETKDKKIKKGKVEVIKEMSNKLNSIEEKADEDYEKVKKKN